MWSLDGKHIVSVGEDGKVQIRDVEKGEMVGEIRPGHGSRVSCVAVWEMERHNACGIWKKK